MRSFMFLITLFTNIVVRGDLIGSFTIVGEGQGKITTEEIKAASPEYTFNVAFSLDKNQIIVEATRDLGGPDSDLLQLYMFSRDKIIAPGLTFNWETNDALSGAGWVILTGKPAGSTKLRSTGDGGSTVTINELDLNPDHTVRQLSIDFTTVYKNFSSPPNIDTGSIRITSSAAVPEASTAGMCFLATLLLFWRKK